MKITLLQSLILFLLTSSQLLAQQIKFGGNQFIHTTGLNSVFVGIGSGYNNTGSNNTFFGSNTGLNHVSGIQDTFIGSQAGYNNTSGSRNTFLGVSSGYANTMANDNTFLGSYTGASNMMGAYNTFMGSFSGYLNTTGEGNAFIGASAGYQNLTGLSNVFIGSNAGKANADGNFNTFLGTNSGSSNTGGNYNTLIGYQTGLTNSYLTNASAIGAKARVAINDTIVLGDPDNSSIKVGIGTDSPQFTLDVRGTVNLGGSGSKLKFGNLKNTNLRKNSTDKFLTVNEQGETVLARYRISILDPNQWADKVFTSTYQLRPLASLAVFVEQHGHLPGVPSASEVVREGVDIAKLNVTLLEKIEELTLYSIQLEKANQQQRADIDELKWLVKQMLKK